MITTNTYFRDEEGNPLPILSNLQNKLIHPRGEKLVLFLGSSDQLYGP